MPFWADNELDLGNIIMKEDVDLNQDREASLELKELILKLLNKEASERPTIAELLDSEPFLTKSE